MIKFFTSPQFLCIGMLIISNILMTFAWYGHLKYKEVSLGWAILVSWGIAGLEYCVMIPANRIGHGVFTVTELKIIQEILTLTVFSGFVIFFMHEKLHWNHIVAFLCIFAAAFFTFLPKGD